jgi:hypothetical protein
LYHDIQKYLKYSLLPNVVVYLASCWRKNAAITPAEFVSTLKLFGGRIKDDERCGSCDMLALEWAMLENFKVTRKKRL